MKRLVKTEFYKLCKADHALFIVLLFFYPVLWSVLAYRGQIILVDNGNSMLSWILKMLLNMDKMFLIPLIFALIINTITGEEIRKGYFSVVQSEGVSGEMLYLSKAAAVIGYLAFLFLTVTIESAICYLLFVRGDSVMATGNLWNNGELIPGMEILLIWILDRCVLFPGVFIWLSKTQSTGKTIVIMAGLILLDRGIALFPGIAFLSIWNNYKNADYFVSLCKEGELNIHMSILIQIILYSCIVILLIKRQKKRRRNESRAI